MAWNVEHEAKRWRRRDTVNTTYSVDRSDRGGLCWRVWRIRETDNIILPEVLALTKNEEDANMLRDALTAHQVVNS